MHLKMLRTDVLYYLNLLRIIKHEIILKTSISSYHRIFKAYSPLDGLVKDR